MSIINTFDNLSEEILKPSHVFKKIEKCPEVIIVTFKQEIIDIATEIYPHEIIDYMYAGFPIPIYTIEYNKKKVGLYLTALGGSACVGFLEEIIAKGGKKIIFFGACGSLDESLSNGHLIVPTLAYRDEGTSYHYMGESNYVQVETAERLGIIFEELKVPYIYGKTWTTDGFYRKTKNNIKARKDEGCITVEMECASIMAAAKFRHIEVYQFLYTDNIFTKNEWDLRTKGTSPENIGEHCLQIALEVAEKI